MTIYGYARVSTKEQSLEVQTRELTDRGATKIFHEKISGKNITDRPQLQKLMDTITEGDTLVVTKLDRISRSLKDGIQLIEELTSKGVTLVIANMGTFDNTPNSKLLLGILLSVAEFERAINHERTMEGVALAKERGAYKGRVKKYTSKNPKVAHALELYDNRETNGYSANQIAEITGMSRATLYRSIRERDDL
ncbi:recombinase family protein [Bacillus sp. UNC322MFChir4.1]|uniref:recombinase family protein n=1 Tax=Bacillus sp. UNC322MFChir4.1 TaxID=1449045 RepID=UPI000553D301|nr:recombinase family protein [Bacillus sp. UNC322MFChir4.1]